MTSLSLSLRPVDESKGFHSVGGGGGGRGGGSFSLNTDAKQTRKSRTGRSVSAYSMLLSKNAYNGRLNLSYKNS